MRIITANGINFEEAPYQIITEPSIFEKTRNITGVARESVRLTLSGNYDDIASAFRNGVEWIITETFTDEDGREKYSVYDKSEFSVAGDIIDHRNGTFTVYMAKPTESEKLRIDIETVLPALDDKTAAKVPNLYPEFTVGRSYTAGERLSYGGVLYRVLQTHTSQTDWTPNIAVSLFELIG